MIEDAKRNSEKLLIVGCGDLGRRLAAHLPTPSYAVDGVRRHPPENDPRIHYRAVDTSDRAAMRNVLQDDYDVVVVTMTPSERTDAGYHRAYVQTCEHLIEGLCEHAKTPRLILYVSSTGVYQQNDGEWIDERSVTGSGENSGRVQHLLNAESVIANSGFAHCIVRFSGIYGPGRDRFVERVRRGRATLSGRYTNRIHSEDCAGILAHLIERQRQGKALDTLYLASDCEPAPMAEVVNWLSQQLKVDKARFAPEEGGLGKRCDNRRLLGTGYRFAYPDYRAGYTALLSPNGQDASAEKS